MAAIRRVLEAELQAEQEFVAGTRQSEKTPKGWPAALLMFHLSMWRERLRNALHDLSQDRPYSPPPDHVDEFNDAELANGIGTPLTDAAARSETLHREIMALHEALGERPFKWYKMSTTTEAVLRVSYLHPRVHMHAYANENGDTEQAMRLFEDAATELRHADAPPFIMGAAIYNLAVVRVAEHKVEEALTLLEEAVTMRPDLVEVADDDAELAALRDEERFQKLVT